MESDVIGKFNIEMQTTSNKYLYHRFQFTTCKLYVEQISSGEDYSLLNKACGIVIYSVNHYNDQVCHHKFLLYDKEHDLEYRNSIEIHSLEILKRDQLLKNKTPEEIERLKPLYKWLQFFDSKTEEDYMEAAQGNAVMENAWDLIKIMSRSDEERQIAEAVALRRGDEIAQYKSGYEDGEKKGKEENRREIAAEMLSDNEPIDRIIKYSHLTEEEIIKIQGSLQK